MTVAELIEALQECDPQGVVTIYSDEEMIEVREAIEYLAQTSVYSLQRPGTIEVRLQ
jgi:tRNA(Ser,Leu) C12 N-acetylase TAN1